MKTTFEIIQAIICALLLINIGIMIAASLDRKSRRYAEKTARDVLRVKLLAGGKRGEYALNVSPLGVKIATVREYNLAVFTGVKDFWEYIPMFDGAEDCLSGFEQNADAGDGKSRVTCIFDGYSKTFTTQAVNMVPEDYVCTVATPQEVRDAVRKAKDQSACGDAKRRQI